MPNSGLYLKEKSESFGDSCYDFQIAAFEIAQFQNSQESFGAHRENVVLLLEPGWCALEQ